jgi:hypothetical protein
VWLWTHDALQTISPFGIERFEADKVRSKSDRRKDSGTKFISTPKAVMGFGVRKQGLQTDQWIERFGDWLQLQGLLSADEADPAKALSLPVAFRRTSN